MDSYQSLNLFLSIAFLSTGQDYEVVVLVGAGIGVTPFASVLADMVNKMEGSVCRTCGDVQENAGAGIKVQKIYFRACFRLSSSVKPASHLSGPVGTNLLSLNSAHAGVPEALCHLSQLLTVTNANI